MQSDSLRRIDRLVPTTGLCGPVRFNGIKRNVSFQTLSPSSSSHSETIIYELG